jgi:F-type H+-transporting ATPase subunit delta
VKSPVFSREVQARALTPVLEKMGVSKLTSQFLLLLAAKRRLFALEGMIAGYERLVARARGETEAEVISARALADGELAELKSTLKARLGREPRLHTKVDPSLLGGLVVKVGSRMIDTSLRTKLTSLRAAMKGQ